MKISREIKAAFIVLSSLILLVWGFSFLKGENLLVKDKTLYFFIENAQGLSSASIVTYNGLQIGKVKSVEYEFNKNTKRTE